MSDSAELDIKILGIESASIALMAFPASLMLGQIRSAMEEVASNLTEWAKTEHVWEDRTFATRELTNAEVTEATELICAVTLASVTAGHREGAGKWLELNEALKERYSWLGDIIPNHLSEIIEILKAHGASALV